MVGYTSLIILIWGFLKAFLARCSQQQGNCRDDHPHLRAGIRLLPQLAFLKWGYPFYHMVYFRGSPIKMDETMEVPP